MNVLRKDWLSGGASNIDGDIGGLIAGAGGYTDIVLNLSTQVTVESGADLNVEGFQNTPGGLDLDAFNDILVKEKISLTSGGLGAGAGGDISIVTTRDLAKVNVAANAGLDSVGDINISARGTADVVAQLNMDTYGVATVGVADTLVEVRPDNQVMFGSGAHVRTDGDLNISAGTSTDFFRDQYDVEARSDTFAGSAIPIDDVDATATLDQNNRITVSAGAVLETARDARLHAERFGLADVIARAKAVSWVSELEDALSGVNSELFNGTASNSASGIVTVDGTVRTGIKRIQGLHITGIDSLTGDIIATSLIPDSITYNVTTESLKSTLVKDLENARKQLAQYRNDNQTLEDFYQGEIDRIVALLEAEGLWEVDASGRAGYAETDVLTVNIDPIWAQAGFIDVRADRLIGNGGDFDAPGDASVNILNETQVFVNIKGIVIPESNGGLRLNGDEVNSNADVNAVNGIFGGANFANITDNNSAAAPSIRVENSFDPTSTPEDEPAPAIMITGAVDNLGGSLELINLKGDIEITAAVRAKNISIVSGGNVYIDGVTQYSVGGETYSALASLTNNHQSASSDSAVETLLTSARTDVNLFADRIFINAEYINVNGIVQSGKEVYSLTIGQTAVDEINDISSSTSGRVLLESVSDSDFSVYYDTATGKIEIEDVRVGGGYIELHGNILSSASGEIRVLGGFGEIEIINNTDFDVVLNRVDASQRGTGTLLMVDKAQGTATSPLVTLYQKTAAGVVVTQDDGTGPVRIGQNVADPNVHSYQTSEGWRYGYSVDIQDAVIKTVEVGTSAWLGIGFLAADPAPSYWDSIRRLSGPSLSDEGPYYYKAVNLKDDPYTFSTVTVTDRTERPEPTYRTESTWYGKKTYFTKYTEESYTTTTNTHTVKADRPITVRFIGEEQGTVNLTSNRAGADFILRGPILNGSGVTTINTQGAITQLTDDAFITAQRIDIDAAGDIGSAELALNTNLSELSSQFNSNDGVVDLNTPDYLYTAVTGVPQDQELKVGDTVRLAVGFDSTKGVANNVYQYIGGVTQTLDLADQDYRDGSLWKQISQSNEDVVQLADNFSGLGEPSAFYRYVGGAGTFDLRTENYNDTSRWVQLDQQPGLVATSASGDIHINEISGDLAVDHVVAARGDVSLTAKRNILAAKQDGTTWTEGLVQGSLITLTAEEGGIGHSPARTLVLDSSSALAHGVTVTAKQDVFLSEKDGDLRLRQLITETGDVYIKIHNGSLVDGDSTVVRDERTREQLVNTVWADLQLTGSDASAKLQEAKDQLADVKEQEYNAYWDYRKAFNEDKVGGLTELATYYVVVDGDSIRLAETLQDAEATTPVTIGLTASTETGAEHKLFTDVAGGLFVSFDSSATGVNSATGVITLDPGHGMQTGDAVTYIREVFEAPYDVSQQVTIVGAERDAYEQFFSATKTESFDPALAVNADSSLYVPGNGYETGQAVVYSSNGGAVIDGLLEGGTYYVHIAPGNSANIHLAENETDALNGDVITLDSSTATGSDHTLTTVARSAAEVDAAIQTLENKRTVEYHDLHGTYGVNGGPDDSVSFAIGNFDPDTFDPNFEYTLTQAEIDRIEGSVKIWTEDELLNLMAAGLLEPVTRTVIDFEDANISTAGNVVIEGSANVGVSSGRLEIDVTGGFGSISTDDRAELAAAEQSDIAFITATRADNLLVNFNFGDANADTITRSAASGSWLTDGFRAGMTIQVWGDSANEKASGYYEIAAVSDTTITLVTDTGDRLETEASAPLTIVQTVVDPNNTPFTITHVAINLRDDIDIDALGTINVQAGVTPDTTAFIGSELDINLDQITATGEIRVKSGQNVINAASGAGALIIGGDLILEAGEGFIGEEGNRITTDLKPDGNVTARAAKDIYLVELAGDMNVATIFSRDGGAYLVAEQGSITDGLNNDFENIRTGTVIDLTAEQAIGEVGNFLDINLGPNAVLNALAQDDIRIAETLGNMTVAEVKSETADVYLTAHLSILDAEGDIEADVIGNSITLDAGLTIGVSGNDLDIDTAYSTPNVGRLTSTSFENSYIIEVAGDLRLNNVSTTGGDFTAFIAAPVGRILNDDITGNGNVLGGRAWLFAAQDIGEANKAIITTIGNIESQSTTGSTWVQNLGELSVGGVIDSPSGAGMRAGGSIILGASSPVTVTEDQIAETGDIIIVAHDDNLDDGTPGNEADHLIVKSGITVDSEQGSVRLLAGDDLHIEAGAVIRGATFVELQGDWQGDEFGNDPAPGHVNVDDAGGTITVDGTIETPLINIFGADDDDIIILNPESLVGDTFVFGRDGDDQIIVNELHSRTEQLVLDGEGGTDRYTIHTTGTSDYVIDVLDSGAPDDGADRLTIDGTDEADTFLLRKHFVAQLQPTGLTGENEPRYEDTLERINYNENINARLRVDGGEGNDEFFVDDNSSITTLDGGNGDDFFQFGQLFGSDRIAPQVADGDEIETVETTLGFLSAGINLPTTVFGGDGNDNFSVYSNKALLKLFGEDGNDNFVVRAFIIEGTDDLASTDTELNGGDGDDNIEYNINAPLSIDGGAGADTITVLGTERDDNFVITEDGVQGAGLNVDFFAVEKLEVDGLEGDDHFFVLSTNEDLVTTLIGGLGSDTFDVGGDVTGEIVALSVEGRTGFINHALSSDDPAYDSIFAPGVQLKVADNETGAVGIDQNTDILVEDGTCGGCLHGAHARGGARRADHRLPERLRGPGGQ